VALQGVGLLDQDKARLPVLLAEGAESVQKWTFLHKFRFEGRDAAGKLIFSKPRDIVIVLFLFGPISSF